MASWERVAWAHQRLVIVRSKYDDAMDCIVRTRNDGALPVLEILVAEVDRLNLTFHTAVRLCEGAADDSRLMTLA